MANQRTIGPRAKIDLGLIWSFIAADSEKAANAAIDLITEKMGMLTDHPRAGRSRVDLRADLRCFPVGRYIIFYFVLSDGINVVRVMHSSQDISPDDLT